MYNPNEMYFVVLTRENKTTKADIIHDYGLTSVAITDKQNGEQKKRSFDWSSKALDLFSLVCIGLSQEKTFDELADIMASFKWYPKCYD